MNFAALMKDLRRVLTLMYPASAIRGSYAAIGPDEPTAEVIDSYIGFFRTHPM
jgi:hypothetical protein